MSVANPFKKWNPGSATCDWCADPFECPPCPSVNFTWTVEEDGLTYNFTDTTSPEPTSWFWDFGDGGTSTSQNPTHVFSGSAGEVTLTVNGREECQKIIAFALCGNCLNGATPGVWTVVIPAYSGCPDDDDGDCAETLGGTYEVPFLGVGGGLCIWTLYVEDMCGVGGDLTIEMSSGSVRIQADAGFVPMQWRYNFTELNCLEEFEAEADAGEGFACDSYPAITLIPGVV